MQCKNSEDESSNDGNYESSVQMSLSVPGRKRKLRMSLHLGLDDDFDYDWDDWLRENALTNIGFRPRSIWVHPVNAARPTAGEFARICVPYRQYPQKFFRYFRMSVPTFDYFSQSIEHEIVKHSIRPSISPAERLSVTLRLVLSQV